MVITEEDTAFTKNMYPIKGYTDHGDTFLGKGEKGRIRQLLAKLKSNQIIKSNLLKAVGPDGH